MERERENPPGAGGQSYRASLGPSQDGWAAGQQMPILAGKSHSLFRTRMEKEYFSFLEDNKGTEKYGYDW